MVVLVLLVHREQLVLLERMVAPVLPVHKERLVLPVKTDAMVKTEQPDHKAP